jgi:hypothetical protein
MMVMIIAKKLEDVLEQNRLGILDRLGKHQNEQS